MLKRTGVGVVLVLLLVPGIAHAGDFPGLIETLISVLVGISLFLGMATEGVLALIQHRKFRWLNGLLYTLLWGLGILVLLWSRRA